MNATQPNKTYFQKQMLQNMANLKLNADTNPNTEDIKTAYITMNDNDEAYLTAHKTKSKTNTFGLNDANGNFSGKKTDPKYQTLPYSSQFGTGKAVNPTGIAISMAAYNNNKLKLKENEHLKANEAEDVAAIQQQLQHIQLQQQQQQNALQQPNALQQLTVHSMPLTTVNKSVAVPISNVETSTSATMTMKDEMSANPALNDPVEQKLRPALKEKSLISKENILVSQRKPISSVAPTPISLIPKPVAANTKVNMVAPSINSVPIMSHTVSEKIPALPPKPNKSPESEPSTAPPSSASSNYSPPNGSNGSNSSAPPTVLSMVNKPAATDGKMQMQSDYQFSMICPTQNHDNLPIKAKPLTIKKQPLSEQPRLRSLLPGVKPSQFTSRRIEMPPSFLFPETETASLKTDGGSTSAKSATASDETDKAVTTTTSEEEPPVANQNVIRRTKSSLSEHGKTKLSRRVSFDPLALLLDASLEGELELVQKTATQVGFTVVKNRIRNSRTCIRLRLYGLFGEIC